MTNSPYRIIEPYINHLESIFVELSDNRHDQTLYGSIEEIEEIERAYINSNQSVLRKTIDTLNDQTNTAKVIQLNTIDKWRKDLSRGGIILLKLDLGNYLSNGINQLRDQFNQLVCIVDNMIKRSLQSISITDLIGSIVSYLELIIASDDLTSDIIDALDYHKSISTDSTSYKKPYSFLEKKLNEIKNNSVVSEDTQERINELEMFLTDTLNFIATSESKHADHNEDFEPTEIKAMSCKVDLLIELGILQAIKDYQNDKTNNPNINQLAQILIDLGFFAGAKKSTIQSYLNKHKNGQWETNSQRLNENLTNMKLII